MAVLLELLAAMTAPTVTPTTAKQRALIELIFAGVIWGFGFIATRWALDGLQPFTATTLRFALASGVIFILIALRPSWRKLPHKKLLRLSVWPAFFLSATLLLQTWGLVTTTATKSGFITTLYVLLVPMAEGLFFKKRIHPLLFVWVLLALLGTALISDFTAGSWNFGDGLTLLCAITASGHIIAVGRVSSRVESAAVFNAYQTLGAAVFSFFAAWIFESGNDQHMTALSLYGLLYLAILSTLVAFMLQVRAQKVLSNTVASFLFLLESPFAACFAFLVLNERMGWAQWSGAVLILISSLLTIRTENRQTFSHSP